VLPAPTGSTDICLCEFGLQFTLILWVLTTRLSRGVNPTDIYRRVVQRETFSILLGSAALGEQYINLVNDYFLSKGHLVAKADFFYGTGQMATFFYANALPQWQTFNGGNWNTLEDNVRAFASRHGRNLEVYTGGSFRATLPNVNNVQTNLALTTNGLLPVPRMFWKILYDPTTQAGIAFIGLNNPYQSAAEAAADVRCTDISSTVSWLTWQQTNLVRGYSYTCEVNNFRANFPDIPSFTVTSILR
jgi:DNA/RNA non-specific endonuclease